MSLKDSYTFSGEANHSLRNIFWTGIICIILVIVLTFTLLVLHFGNFLPNGADVIFVSPKNPSFDISDEDKDWNNDQSLSVFKSKYLDADGNILVESADEEALIAPGVTSSYKFYLKNGGNMAIDYIVSIAFSFLIDGKSVDLNKIPLEVRLQNFDGNYIVGSENSFVPVSKVKGNKSNGTLGINSYTPYTLEFTWPKDTDNEYDTFLGTITEANDVDFSLDMSISGVQSENPNAKGGTLMGEVINTPAGTVRTGPVIAIILFVLLILTVVIGTVIYKKKYYD